MTEDDGFGPLTESQVRFIESYLTSGGNLAASYRSAKGPDTPISKNDSRRGRRMLQAPAVAARIRDAEHRARQRTDAVIERYAVSEERILTELASVAFASPMDVIRFLEDGSPVFDLSGLSEREAAAISEVTIDEFTDGRGDGARQVRRMRVKQGDKLRALNLLGTRLGLFRKDVTVTGARGQDWSVDGRGLSALVAEAARLAARDKEDDGAEPADPQPADPSQVGLFNASSTDEPPE